MYGIQEECSRIFLEKDSVLFTNLYGTITRFDIDQEKVRKKDTLNRKIDKIYAAF